MSFRPECDEECPSLNPEMPEMCGGYSVESGPGRFSPCREGRIPHPAGNLHHHSEWNPHWAEIKAKGQEGHSSSE